MYGVIHMFEAIKKKEQIANHELNKWGFDLLCHDPRTWTPSFRSRFAFLKHEK